MSPDESGIFRVPKCTACGGPVEEDRRVYVIPTCHACLPPPPPLDLTPRPLTYESMCEAIEAMRNYPPRGHEDD